MLKQVPYNNKLIPIGNAPVYEGKMVYTDGQVAYGWLYTPQRPNCGSVRDFSGFWVGEQGQISIGRNWYKLANEKTLRLNHKILSGGHFDLQCYPCYAGVEYTGGYLPEHGKLYMPNGLYLYDGAIIAMAENGSLLTYKDYLLKFYTTTGLQKEDTENHPLFYCNLSLSVVNDVSGFNFSFIGWYYVAIYGNTNYIIYDSEFLKIAEVTENNGSFRVIYNYDGQYIDSNVMGVCTFIINSKNVLLDSTVIDVNLFSLHSQDTVIYNGIIAVDGLRLAIDSNDVRMNLIQQNDYGNILRKLFQLATTGQSYLTARTVDRDLNDNIIYNGDYSVIYNMLIGTGTCTVTVNGSVVTIYDPQTGTEIAHTNGNLLYVNNIYVGHGRISYDNYNNSEWDYSIWLYIDGITGTGVISYIGNNVVIKDVNTGNYIARANGTNAYVYYNGVLLWYGPCIISIRSTTPIEWLGDYTIHTTQQDIIGHGKITENNNDIFVYDETTGDLIAEENGSDVIVYSGGSVTYNGPGNITTANLVPCTWLGTYELSASVTGTETIIKKDVQQYCDYLIRRSYDGFSFKIQNPTNNIIVYFKDKIATLNVNINTVKIEQNVNNTYVQIYDGPGNIFVSNLNLIDVDNDIYEGDYLIWLDKTGFGIAETDVNNKLFIYDTNNNLIANEDNNGIVIYDNGNVDYQGPGTITTSNTVKNIDNVVVYDSDNHLIAEENGENIEVYDNQRQLIYSGPGWIDTNNLTPVFSIKKYHVTPQNGLQITQQYPTEWQAGTDVKLKLSNMDLEITIQRQGVTTVVTVTNDPLGLLATQGFIFAGGVHACNTNGFTNNVISQDTGLIWQYIDNAQPLTETYAGIANCFNLALLKRRWK